MNIINAHYLTHNFPTLSEAGPKMGNFELVTTEISDLFVRLYQIAPLGSQILNLAPLPIHSLSIPTLCCFQRKDI